MRGSGRCIGTYPHATRLCALAAEFFLARAGGGQALRGGQGLGPLHAPGEAEEYAVEDARAFRITRTMSCSRKENLVKQPSALAPHTLPGSPPAEWEQWV